MNQLSFGNIDILPVPNVITFGTANIDSSELTINTDIKNIGFIKNWIQIISNPKIPFNMEDYVCDIKLETNNNTYYLRKVWPHSALDSGQFCVIKFIFDSYSFNDNITYKPYIDKPYVKKQNKKELEKIEINKIMDELDDWLKNPEKNWDKRLVSKG